MYVRTHLLAAAPAHAAVVAARLESEPVRRVRVGQHLDRREGWPLAVTRYCHYQYCIVYGIQRNLDRREGWPSHDIAMTNIV